MVWHLLFLIPGPASILALRNFPPSAFEHSLSDAVNSGATAKPGVATGGGGKLN